MDCFRDRHGYWFPVVLVVGLEPDPDNPRDYVVHLRRGMGIREPMTVKTRKSRLYKYIEQGAIPPPMETRLAA